MQSAWQLYMTIRLCCQTKRPVLAETCMFLCAGARKSRRGASRSLGVWPPVSMNTVFYAHMHTQALWDLPAIAWRRARYPADGQHSITKEIRFCCTHLSLPCLYIATQCLKNPSASGHFFCHDSERSELQACRSRIPGPGQHFFPASFQPRMAPRRRVAA